MDSVGTNGFPARRKDEKSFVNKEKGQREIFVLIQSEKEKVGMVMSSSAIFFTL